MAGGSSVLDAAVIRREFPVLTSEINGKPVVYLDSANTSQKPNVVIDAMTTFMRE
ncbi:MAG: cysteine desulfurase, partial [Actinobacteria bacterium]|nr:cysteine desulfurase [Actinomycetota bacterium]